MIATRSVSIRSLSLLILSVSLLAGTHSARASLFGKDKQPVPQWGLDAAKTKTPDYAKDSEAVILFDETVDSIDSKGRATEKKRTVVRILKPQGRQHPCYVPFDIDEKINFFRSWTITAEEKTFQAQDTDFVDFGDLSDDVMLSTEKYRVVIPPAAEIGAVVVCESEELTQPWLQETIWQIQSDEPVVFQAFELDLPDARSYSASWHHYAEAKPEQVAPNHWRWEVHDLRAIDLRDVPSAPAEKALTARVNIQWGDTALADKTERWRAMGIWLSNLESHRPDPSPEITAKTQELIARAPDLYTKLSRITGFIQENIRYFIVLRGIGGMQAHYANEIFRNRYGDCKDKATILISMLQVAGINADYLAVDSHRGFVDPDAPSIFGDHMITAIEIPADNQDSRFQAIAKSKSGKRYLIFDPTDERTVVGNLRSELQGSYGMLGAGNDSELLAIPILIPDANMNTSIGSFTLQVDGTLTGSVDSKHEGAASGIYRYLLKTSNEKERREYWERHIGEDIPGVVLDNLTFTEPKDLDKPLELSYKITAKQYAHQAGPLLLVRAHVVSSFVRYFDEKLRTVPIDLYATGHWHQSYDIMLPPGYVVDETPDPVDVDTDFISYHSKTTAKDGKLHYERDYQVKQVELQPGKSPVFRMVESSILRDEKGTAVLKKQ